MTRPQITAAIVAWLADNLHELLVALALVLLARGLLDVWRPGAYIVPGAVLLWIVLPTRRAFIVSDSPKKGNS
jgi:hypothetical protein